MERGARWRPSVAAFADMMEDRLREKDHEWGGDSWKNADDRAGAAPSVLATNIQSRAAKLCRAAFIAITGARDNGRYVDPAVADLRKLAPDTANFAMMLLDVMHELPAPATVDPLEAEFDIVVAPGGMNKFVTLPAYRRNNETIFLRLMLTSAATSEETVASWTDEQAREADLWAVSVHMSASDHDDILVPPIPDHIKLLPDWSARNPDRNPITGEPI